MITERLLDQIKQGREGKNHGYSTGSEKLDLYTDGNVKNNFIVLFSNSGSGKSSLALYSYVYKPIVESFDSDNFKCIYFSLELTAEQLLCKLLGLYLYETYGVQLSLRELLSRKKNYILSDDNYSLVEKSTEWLKKVESKLIVYDKSLNASKLYSILMKELEKIGTFEEYETRKIFNPINSELIFNVIIDHISLLRPENGRTLKQEIDITTSYLITLKNMCKISPIIIQQANRNQGSMERRKENMMNMTINDTKDSGDPVQAAEVVISIFNPNRERLKNYRGYDISELQDKFRSITILKSRWGESDIEIGFNFFGNVNIWRELPLPDEIYNYENYKYLDKSESINSKNSINFTI